MAKHGISLQHARRRAEQEMGRPCKGKGFSEVEIGPHIVNVFYYSVEYDEIGTHYRADVYVDGKRNTGITIP